MFWLLPRDMAANVLTTWETVVKRCLPGAPCCNLTHTIGAGRAARISYSFWLGAFWSRNESGGYAINSTGLRGYGAHRRRQPSDARWHADDSVMAP